MVNAYKPGRRDWVPITVFIIGMTALAVAVAWWSLYLLGVHL